MSASDVWFCCNNDEDYEPLKNHGDPTILFRDVRDPHARGDFAHQLHVATLSIIDMDSPIAESHRERFDLFLKNNFPKKALSCTDDMSYNEIYKALYASRPGNIDPRFLSLLGVDGAIYRHAEYERLCMVDLSQCPCLESSPRQLPSTVWFHGSREQEPIEVFQHGVYPSHAGFAGFGTVEVSRHAFFFSSDPRMSEEFGHVHAYQVNTASILDLRQDVSECDEQKLRDAGLSPESIDRMHEKWELFDGEPGQEFSQALLSAGYEAVQYLERDHHGVLRDCLAVLTTTVIQPVYVDPKLLNARIQSLTIFDAWYAMYSQHRRSLTTEQLTRELSSISEPILQQQPRFYRDIESMFRDYNYAGVQLALQASLAARPHSHPPKPVTDENIEHPKVDARRYTY